MQIPARLLRARAMEIDPTLAELTPRETEREQRILRNAQSLFARFGRHAITFTALAIAMKMAPRTLRKHFTCLDALFAEILTRHLQHVAAACLHLPNGAPAQARRAAYLAATRTKTGELTEAHRLFVQQRLALPPDALEQLEAAYLSLGATLGGPSPHETLSILDNPYCTEARIETLLATYATSQPQATVKPPAPPEISVPAVLPKPQHQPAERHAATAPEIPAPTPPMPPALPSMQPAASILPLDPATLRACLRMSRKNPPPRPPRPAPSPSIAHALRAGA